MEHWKDIKGYEGLYQVSDIGRIMNVKTKQIIKTVIEKNGYVKFNFRYNGKTKSFRVHRLVAEAFIPNPKNCEQVDHINTNRSDNRVENLQWVSCKENHHNAITEAKYKEYYPKHSQLLKDKYVGKSNPMARKVYQYDNIYNLINIYDCCVEASDKTGVSYSGICKSANTQGVRKSGGFRWCYTPIN